MTGRREGVKEEEGIEGKVTREGGTERGMREPEEGWRKE